jgi:hypothetical protein
VLGFVAHFKTTCHTIQSRDSLVGIASTLWAGRPRIWGSISGRGKILSDPITSKQALEITQPPLHLGLYPPA